MLLRSILLAGAMTLAAAPYAAAQEKPTPPGAAYKPNVPPERRKPFFGEMHLHTTMSFDAWTFGTKITPDQAYRFGRGQTVMVPAEQIGLQQQPRLSGQMVPAKRAWPLDFMAVTDHSEAMGAFNAIDDPNSELAKSPIGQKVKKDPHSAFFVIANARAGGGLPPGLNIFKAARSAWEVEINAANTNYVPGKFTTFIAYEWSSLPQGKYNLHRNVFFNSDHAPLPFTSVDSQKPEDLWTYLEKTRASGIDVIAIPHNGNVSGGLMYDWNDSAGRPIDQQYAQRRMLNEPLTEIAQNKGQSDTVPQLSPNDEFANFEIFDHLITWPNIKGKIDGSYIRQAFGRGLEIDAKVGANPYKFGVVGASDIHNGLSTSDEKAFAGGPFGIDPQTMSPGPRNAKVQVGMIKVPALLDMDAINNHAPPSTEDTLMFSSGGLTGVWAEENTRNAIFAALKRKETFATTGSRIRVRMFAGWTYDAKMIQHGDWVARAYAEGAPMGGDMPVKPAGAGAPTLILQAQKDPDGANLDRIQVIKIWLDKDGYKEKLFDAALSGGRKASPTGRARAVGNTVDLKTGRYANTIGAATFTTTWVDPEFNPAKPAVYYARVLEIPTPRWSTLLAIRNHLPIPKTVATTLQERAWASPIWYTPTKP
jgi:hypothetical protein